MVKSERPPLLLYVIRSSILLSSRLGSDTRLPLRLGEWQGQMKRAMGSSVSFLVCRSAACHVAKPRVPFPWILRDFELRSRHGIGSSLRTWLDHVCFFSTKASVNGATSGAGRHREVVQDARNGRLRKQGRFRCRARCRPATGAASYFVSRSKASGSSR